MIEMMGKCSLSDIQQANGARVHKRSRVLMIAMLGQEIRLDTLYFWVRVAASSDGFLLGGNVGVDGAKSVGDEPVQARKQVLVEVGLDRLTRLARKADDNAAFALQATDIVVVEADPVILQWQSGRPCRIVLALILCALQDMHQ